MPDGLTDHEFAAKAESAIEALQRGLLGLADEEGFEIDLEGGVLKIEFEEPSNATFVISPNAPVRQIWVSALVQSYKLAWSQETGAFALGGETLTQLVERLVRLHLGR
ncbi:MAG TPA: iron donor protein CyaY [Vicinamibacterales bacterium]|nr:iron donor protein CyaY [Vicinamibacterales bacterium]HPW19284.1 iron donor protein CyaY [Vicinamibacterales bacterium]